MSTGHKKMLIELKKKTDQLQIDKNTHKWIHILLFTCCF
jgi:hypothetical protein